MKKILIETSNSFSNVFIGMNSFFQKKHNVRLINCNGALINKIIDKTQGIWKPKLYKSGMSLMPGFHTGLARNNLTWIHDTLHNNELMVFGKKTGRFNYFKEFINNLSKKSEYIITPSLYSKNKLIADLKINDKNIIVMPYQISTKKYFKIINNKTLITSVKNKFGFNDEKFNIIFVGSPHYRKNLKQVYKVFLKLISKKIDAHLYVVSYKRKDIPMTYNLYSEIENHSNTTLLKHISDEENIALLNSCDVLFNPTLEEGFGLPNIEAQICQTPVLSSNVSCIPEILGNSAVLLNPNDDEAQINYLLKIYQDLDFKNNLIKKGNSNIIRFNNLDRYELLYDILNNL